MKGTFLKTYVVLGVLAILGAYMYFVESKSPEEGEKKKQKVFSFAKAKVKEFSLTPRSGDLIRLAKDGSSWKMTAPMAVDADSSSADSLLGSLEDLESDETISESPQSLQDYGLDPPQNTVAFLLTGASEPLKLLVGSKTPDGSSVYAKLPTNARVFTIPSYEATTFDKKPFDFRDRSLLHVKRDDVRSVEITGPDGSYSLAKADKGEWAFTKPLVTRAGRWGIDGLLGTLENLRMDSVAAEDAKDPKELKALGLLPAARSITVAFADGTTKKLEIGAATKDKKYNARDASKTLVAVIPPTLVDDLAKGMKDLREKRVLDVPAYDVGAFDVEPLGQAKRIYVRSTSKDKDGIEVSKWKRTSPDTKDLDTNKVQDALFKVGSAEAQEFLDQPKGLDAYGLDKPVLRVEIRYAGAKPPTWFEIGKKDGSAYARRPDDVAILKLDPAKTEELLKAFTDL